MFKSFALLAVLAFGAAASADTFQITGSVSDGFNGPATGAIVTLCDYQHPEGFSATLPVPESGVIDVVFPYLPGAVAFDLSGDKNYQDVHILVAASVCPVSPCPPSQSATFAVHLQRRPPVPENYRRFVQ